MAITFRLAHLRQEGTSCGLNDRGQECDDFGVVGRDVASLGEWLPTFRDFVGKQSLNDAALRARRRESLVTRL